MWGGSKLTNSLVKQQLELVTRHDQVMLLETATNVSSQLFFQLFSIFELLINIGPTGTPLFPWEEK